MFNTIQCRKYQCFPCKTKFSAFSRDVSISWFQKVHLEHVTFTDLTCIMIRLHVKDELYFWSTLNRINLVGKLYLCDWYKCSWKLCFLYKFLMYEHVTSSCNYITNRYVYIYTYLVKRDTFAIVDLEGWSS